MTTSPNKEAKRWAGFALRHIGTEDVSYHLSQLLSQLDGRNDEHFILASEIAWSFSKFGHISLIDELISFFFIKLTPINSKKKYDSWMAVVYNLGNFGNALVPRLASILDGDYGSWSKEKAAKAIENLYWHEHNENFSPETCKQAIPALCKIIKEERGQAPFGFRALQASISCLRRLGVPVETFSIFRDLLSYNPLKSRTVGHVDYALNWEKVKLEAACVLAEGGDKSVFPLLLKFSESSNIKTQAAAVEALGRLEDYSAIPRLIEILEDAIDSDRSDDLIAASIAALGAFKSDNSDIIRLFIKYSTYQSSYVRWVAISWLSQYRRKDTLIHVINALQDEDRFFSSTSPQGSLKEIGLAKVAEIVYGEEAVFSLVSFLVNKPNLSAEHESYYWWIADTLDDLSLDKIKASINDLIQLADHPNPRVRGNILYILGKACDHDPELTNDLKPIFRKALQDKDSGVRLSGAKQIWITGDRDAARSVMFGNLEDPDFAAHDSTWRGDSHTVVETSLIKNILYRQDDLAPEALNRAMNSDDDTIRQDVLEGISYALSDGECSADLILPFVIKGIKDEYEWVCRKSLDILQDSQDLVFAQAMPSLKAVIEQAFDVEGNDFREELRKTLNTVQDKFGFYNYEIYQQSPNVPFPPRSPKMPETSKYFIHIEGNHEGPIGDNAIQNIYQTSPEKSIKESAAEIGELLDYLAANYPSYTEADSTAIVQQINQKPELRSRIISTFEKGGTEAINLLTDHPYIKILLAMYQDWRSTGQ